MQVFFGNDYTARHQAVHTHVDSNTSGEVVHLSSQEISIEDALSHLGGTNLFGETYTYVLHGFVDDQRILEALNNKQLPHKIVIVEDSLVAAQKKALQKIAGKENVVFHEFKKTKPRDTEIFKITDAFIARNPKTMWLTYRSLVDQGYTVHQIIGTLWWQIKSVLLVARGATDDLKPFVVSKSKKALAQYPDNQLQKKASDLLTVYHSGHSDGFIESRFEEFVLGIHQ